MARPGRLTQSGLLHEGNFDEWRARIDSILEIYDLTKFTSSSKLCSYHDSQSERALNIMKNQISPALAKRVQPRRHNCPCLLWRSLEGLCQPFRLLDLPKEVRMRIYAGLLRGLSAIESQSLTLACHQLRMETAPYWMPGYTFRLVITPDVGQDAEAFAEKIRSWVGKLGSQNLKYLMHVDVVLQAGGRYDELDLHYIPKIGFRLCSATFGTGDAGAVEKARVIMAPHMAGIEEDRKILGLQGESLFLALSTKAPMWVDAYREWLLIVENGKCE